MPIHVKSVSLEGRWIDHQGSHELVEMFSNQRLPQESYMDSNHLHGLFYVSKTLSFSLSFPYFSKEAKLHRLVIEKESPFFPLPFLSFSSSLFLSMKNKKKNKKMQQFTIPKCCQQPRSHGPRPRTDFSPFLSSSPRLRLRPHQGSDFEFSSCKNSGSSITSSTAYQSRRASFLRLEEQNPKFPLMRLSISSNGDHRCPLNCRQTTCTNVESVAQSAPLEICDSWNNGGHAAEHISSLSYAEVLPYTPNKTASQVAESGNVLAPGCVVWAKTANHTWWPAEVMGERESTNDQTVGRVLVQFYGSHDHAWVDPEGDLSHFEDCFEERICNPTKMFQDALKRALHKKQYLTPSEQWNKRPDAPMNLNHEYQSSDKWNTSSSSRVEDDCHDGGRGKRKRKPKVHFDEVMFPFKSKKKGRRLRIMRHLGLVAPPGSPFTVASHVGRKEIINSTPLWSYLC